MPDLPKRPISQTALDAPPLRLRLRDMVETAAANGGEGWVYWQDSDRTRGSATTIAANTRTQITIDGDGTGSDDTYIDTIPRTTKTLLSNSKVMPSELGDLYLVRFGFKAAMVDPGLSGTEEPNDVLIEFNVNNTFNVHQARKSFMADPGPVRRERNNINAMNGLVGLTVLSTAIAPRLTALLTQITTCVSEQNNTGELFVESGQFFTGQDVLTHGVAFYVTPTTDIQLWAADVLISRLSSPTT